MPRDYGNYLSKEILTRCEFCKRNNLLLVVDAVSSFLADYINMKEHKVDVILTGSQKALACPPGIAIIVLSPEAIDRVNKNTCKSMLNMLSYLALTTSGCGAAGSALDWGSRGRRFKSCHSDHRQCRLPISGFVTAEFFIYHTMVKLVRSIQSSPHRKKSGLTARSALFRYTFFSFFSSYQYDTSQKTIRYSNEYIFLINNVRAASFCCSTA